MRFGSTTAIRFGAATVAAMVLFFAGCDGSNGQAREDSSESITAANAGDRPEGDDCTLDGQCRSYLRCLDNKCAVPPAITGEHHEDTPRVQFVDEQGGAVAEFYVELARTDAEQQQGLMFRREMQPDWGMLFVYDAEAQRSFWMENTFIPLDMIFIDADGEVDSIIESAEPLTRVQRRSRGPAQYVLELNGGTVDDIGIEPGMQVELIGVD